jgi:hypothetical protein
LIAFSLLVGCATKPAFDEEVAGLLGPGLELQEGSQRWHRISSEEAKALLTAFVNQELRRKSLAEVGRPDEGGIAWPLLFLSQRSFHSLKFRERRWVIATEPDPPTLGTYVRASTDEFGKNPQLEAATIYMP